MKIKSIKKIKPRRVYAVSTSTNTFIADGLAHHNCTKCNLFLSGNLAVYLRKLQQKYGMKKADELLKENKTKRWRVKELEEVIKYYQDKLDNL